MERVAGGGISAPEMKHILTRCLGNEPSLEVEVRRETIDLTDGDTVVLCSDGLSNMIEPEEILIIAAAETPAEACRLLVEVARERGGPDNITVQVARVERSATARPA
jgi:protein phosphatase